MSTHATPPTRPPRPSILPRRREQAGFGLVQAVLILLLVGATLAAGALLLQSKRPVQQAVTQEQTLRWADEAVAAFAASNARLPCPSATVHGEEDCSGLRAQGWLPLRTLLGASGTAPSIGPVAYMVYRGGEAAHLDLTGPGNAWQPTLVDGSVREIIKKDEHGNETSRRAFASVNGLDFCRSLELAEASGFEDALARIQGQAGPRNVAYGIAAAGPHASTARLDGANAGNAPSMEAPWREADAGYDDRVRVRTFNSLGQTLGCRLLAGGPAPANQPYDVSIASMDVLAAAVTLHDALALLQTNNMDATESALQGAIKAQASLIFKLVTTAVSISDQISTLVTAAGNLTRAIATCIASLGATCWEVPLKTTAVVTSIVGLGTKGVTLAAKAASLPFVALALDASVKARDLAKKNGPKAPPQDLEEAKQELECTLWARNCKEPNEWKVEYATDGDGNPIPLKDADGKPLYDEHGNPRYVESSRTEVPRIGLEDQVEIAKKEWDALQLQVDMLEQWRLKPWGAGTDADGKLVELTSLGKDGIFRSRIQERISAEQTCDGNDWERCPANYRKRIEEWVCRPAGDGGGVYDANCVEVGTKTEKDDKGNETVVNLGTHDRVLEVSYVFDWDTATRHAVARRKKAEEWTDLNLRQGELARELGQFRDNIKTWFEGGDSILARMKKQRDDAQHCQGLSAPALPGGDMERQQCINARNAVRYIETCEKPVVVTECRFLGSGAGRYVDADCTRRDGTDGNGNALPRDYGLQESTTETWERDTNPQATCKVNMEARRDALQRELDGLATRRGQAASAYAALPSPWVAYPTRQFPFSDDTGYDWFEWAIEVTEDQHGNPTDYTWIRSTVQENYTATRRVKVKDGDPKAEPPTEDEYADEEYTATRSLAWYAREPWQLRSDPSHLRYSAPLLVTSGMELMSKNLCRYFSGRQWNGWNWWWPGSDGLGWWRDAHTMGVYCQRYPYNRAFEDWRRAKVGADNARKNHDDTRAQYDKLKREYDDMLAGQESGSGSTAGMSFGAEASLEHADSRGSSGPQAMP